MEQVALKPLLGIRVDFSDTHTSDEKVYLIVTGLTSPVSDKAIQQLEELAFGMPFCPSGKKDDVEFIVPLKDLSGLTYFEALRVDVAIFNGLIVRGKKGRWSKLSEYPPAPDKP